MRLTSEQVAKIRELAEFVLRSKRSSIAEAFETIAEDAGRDKFPNPSTMDFLRRDMGFVEGYDAAVTNIIALLTQLPQQ